MTICVTRKLIAIFIISVLFNGCTTVLTETAKKALETRTTEDQVTDTKIGAGILDRWTDKDKGLILDVSADVWEQRVLLTGTLDNANLIKEVVALASQDNRIKKVYNEILLVSTAEKEKRRAEQEEKKEGGVGQSVNDFWISTKIQGQLIAANGVKSVNYRWRSVLNKVYVIGKARFQGEKDAVLKIIRETKGVLSVTEYIEVIPPAA